MKKILTLVIVHQEDSVLLGLKKRGFGMGKWNGFGGKLQEGESIEGAAKRELFEEAGIHAVDLQPMGVIEFSWENKSEHVLEVHIFKSTHFEGQPTEGEEMKPQWFNITQIPYEKMWSDDKYWLPLFLAGRTFAGKVVFDEHNNVVEHTLS